MTLFIPDVIAACKTAEELGDGTDSEEDMFCPSTSNEPQEKPQEEKEVKEEVGGGNGK